MLTASPRARATDPITSHEAAHAADKLAANHQRRVLEALQGVEKAGASHLAWLCGLQPYEARKRLPELERMGLVRRTEETAMTRSGRREQVWSVVA